MIEPMLSAQQPPGNAPPRAPSWVAIGSAVLMLLPLPLGLAWLAVLLSRHGRVVESLARAFAEGGVFSYGLLFAALVASVASAVVSFLGAKRGTFPSSASGLVWVLVMLVAFLGAKSNVDAIMTALASVSPADKASILAASIAELLSLQLLSSSLCAAACVCVAFGQVLGALGGPHRAASSLGALGFVALAVSMDGSLMSAAGLREGFSAVAMVSPEQKADLLFQLALEVTQYDRLGALATLAAVGLAVVGGAVAMQFDRRSGILGAAALLVTAVGFRGALLLTDRTLAGADVSTVLEDPGMYLPLDGFATVERVRPYPIAIAGSDCAEITRRVKQELSYRGDRVSDVALGIGLEPKLTHDELLCALSASRQLGGGAVLLVGFGTPREMPKEFPALLKPFFVLFSSRFTVAPVKPLFADQPQPSEVARLIADGVELHADGPVQTFKPPQGSPDLMLTSLRPVRCEWDGAPLALARGAAAAAANGSLLTVVVERPASEN